MLSCCRGLGRAAWAETKTVVNSSHTDVPIRQSGMYQAQARAVPTLGFRMGAVAGSALGGKQAEPHAMVDKPPET